MLSRISSYTIIVLCSAIAGAGIYYFMIERDRPVATGRPIRDFALLDQYGRFHQLSDYSSKKSIVLYSHDPNCPTNKHGPSAVKSIRKRFSPDSTAFLLLNTATGQSDSPRELTQPKDTDLTDLSDEDRLVTESLGIRRSGEVLVIDPSSWTIRYRGPIDDRQDYESENPEISNHYLEDAITAVLSDNPVQVIERPGVGCSINYGAGRTPEPYSYARSIAPLLQKNCISCHYNGGIGPWSMDRHATVKTWAPKIRQAIMLQKMPPWHADPAIGDFAHNRAMSGEEKRTLIRWIEAGAPRGNGSDPLLNPGLEGPSDWPLGPPDIILKVPTMKIPAEGVLAYQYAMLPVPIDKDTWVRAVHMKPSNRQVTHHIFAFVQYPKERKQEEPKWAEGANGFFAAYVPGFPVVPFPNNSGRLIPKGSKIIFQRHYLTIGHPTEDNLELGLYLHQNPPDLEYKMATAVNMKLKIPPHQSVHNENASVVVPEDGELHAIYPHMHYRGRSIRFTATFPDGTKEPLLSVPNYDFQWQTSYQLKQPRHLPAGTQIFVDARFDNSTRNPVNPDPNQEVHWGPLSSDEMLVGYLMYSTRRKDSRDDSEAGDEPDYLNP